MNGERAKTVESRTEEERLAANAKALGDICAYPWNEQGMPGITLRQLYAGMAMQGMMANPNHAEFVHSHAERASLAGLAADALLKELSR